MDKPWVSKWVILRGIWSLKRHASISVPLFECDLDRTDRGRAAASLLAPERTTKTCAVDAQYCPVLKGSEVSQPVIKHRRYLLSTGHQCPHHIIQRISSLPLYCRRLANVGI